MDTHLNPWLRETWTDCVGTRIYANGNEYVGDWKDDKCYGQGKETHTDGTKYVGEWENGK